MNFPYFIAKRITLRGQRTFSKLIVRVTIGAMALAIIAIVLSMAILKGFKEEITNKQRGFFGDIVITKQDLNTSYENSPILLEEEQLSNIRSLPNVVHVYPFATKAGIMKVNSEVEGVLLKGIDQSYNQSYLEDILIEGDTLDFKRDDANEQVIVSSYIANRLNLNLGDRIIMYFVQEDVRPRRLFVQGFYSTSSVELDQVYVIGSLDLIRRLNALKDQEAGAYELRVSDFSKIYDTTEDVEAHIPLTLSATNIIEQMPEIFNWLNMLDMNDNIVFVLMAIVAVINMISALLISILERSSMIGILKALGMRSMNIRKIFLFNSIYIIGYGLAIGNVISLSLYLLQHNTRFLKLDPSIYYIDYVPMMIHWQDVLYLNIALISVALIVLIIPSMLISRISPIKTIQFK